MKKPENEHKEKIEYKMSVLVSERRDGYGTAMKPAMGADVGYLIVINKIISTNRKIIFGRYEMELNQTKMGLSQFLKLCARRENGDQDEAWFRITVILT